MTFSACSCGALFVKEKGRAPVCPKCGEHTYLPAIGTNGEGYGTCANSTGFSAEVM